MSETPSTNFEPCSCLLVPEHTVLRLTMYAEEPMPADLLIDADEVIAVIEDEEKSDAYDEPIPVAQLVLKFNRNVVVFDRGRYVQKYWLKARNMAVCKRGDGK